MIFHWVRFRGGPNTASAENSERGFTLIEIIVALGVSAVTAGVLIQSLRTFQTLYFESVVRYSINTNLRTSLDLVGMNVRQVGENLGEHFPALRLASGSDGESDVLTLRRSLLSEALTLCAIASVGDTSLVTSETTAVSVPCTPANVAGPHAAFQARRVAAGGSTRMFLYDRVGQQGEWVTFQSGGQTGGNHWIATSALSRSYPAASTNLYLLEEYQFFHDADDRSLQLIINGDTGNPQPVAFGIDGFQVDLTMEDAVVLNEYLDINTYSWKFISQLSATLTGSQQRRTTTLVSTLSANYHPRNALSQ